MWMSKTQSSRRRRGIGCNLTDRIHRSGVCQGRVVFVNSDEREFYVPQHVHVLFDEFSHWALLAVNYLYEMITCSIPAGGLINSLRENPALANIFSYSEKV